MTIQLGLNNLDKSEHSCLGVDDRAGVTAALQRLAVKQQDRGAVGLLDVLADGNDRLVQEERSDIWQPVLQRDVGGERPSESVEIGTARQGQRARQPVQRFLCAAEALCGVGQMQHVDGDISIGVRGGRAVERQAPSSMRVPVVAD
jgi:hypothetical protein